MQYEGIRNNNPLNIRRYNNGIGDRPILRDPVLEEFESLQIGIRAALILMRNHITGFNGKRTKFNTIRKLVAVWTHPRENSTDKYVTHVCRMTGYSHGMMIDPYSCTQMCKIAQAMASFECGQTLDLELFISAYSLV